jgi:hypothetical protein
MKTNNSFSALRASFFLFFLVLFAIPVVALGTPQVSSPSHPDSEQWYGVPSSAFAWDSVSGATGYSFFVDDSPETVPDAECENVLQKYYGTRRTGTYYFHIVACQGDERSEPAHYKFNVDRTPPSRIENFSISALDDGTLKLDWDDSTDEHSGIKGYDVYRGYLYTFEINEPGVDKLAVADELSESEFIDDSMEEGRTYFYRVKAVDVAGNPSSISIVMAGRPLTFCDFLPEFDFVLSEDQNLFVEVSAGGQKMWYADITATLPNGESMQLVSRESSTLISFSLDLNGVQDGNVVFSFAGEDDERDECLGESVFVIDSILPEVEWLEPFENQKISGTQSLRVRATDVGENPSGINSVSFFYEDADGDWGFLGFGERNSQDEFLLDWNTSRRDNGRFKIKARATDFGENASEEEIMITLENTWLEEAAAEQAFVAAGEKKREFEAFYRVLREKNVSYAPLDALKQEADSNYSSASDLLESGINNPLAKARAEKAEELYSEALGLVSISVYGSADYVFSNARLEKTFSDAGLSQELIPFAVESIEKFSVSRKIEIIKLSVSDGNSALYHVNIIVSFENASQEAINNLQLVEIVPKNFSESASMLSSNYEIIVLEEDPKIKFVFDNFRGQTSRTLIYSLKELVSQQEADAFIDGGVINDFVAPPIIVVSEIPITGGDFSDASSDLLGGLFSGILGDGSGLGGIAVIVGLLVIILLLVLIVLVAVFIYLRFFKQRGKKRKQTTLSVFK